MAFPLHRYVARELADTTREGDCLISNRPHSAEGYVKVRYAGEAKRLHRLVLEDKLGRSLTADECARHSCHNPPCINPDHLHAGTHADNMADMVAAGRGRTGQRSGEDNSAARLTQAAAEAIRRRYAAGECTQAALAEQAGVSVSTVRAVLKGERYAPQGALEATPTLECVVCGAAFQGRHPRITCSPECARRRRREKGRKALRAWRERKKGL